MNKNSLAVLSKFRQPPSREGKKGITFYLAPEIAKELRTVALNEETTLQSLMIEAANLLLRSRGKSGNAS